MANELNLIGYLLDREEHTEPWRDFQALAGKRKQLQSLAKANLRKGSIY